jgi:D-alanine-D-alanine ligase
MRKRIAIVYNRPRPSRYDTSHETKAVLGVLPCVTSVHRALIELGYAVDVISLSPPSEQVKNTISSLNVGLVFNLFEGFPGEPETETLVPEICSELRLPYTGCPASTLKIALDKIECKKLLIKGGILTPDFQVLNPQKIKIFRLKYPCIVKPVSEDASHGITAESVVNDFSLLEKRVKAISDSYGEQALVEEYIDGREFNVTILGETRFTILPVSEIVYSLPPEMPRILTFDAKWEPDSVYYRGTQAVCPAEISHQEKVAIYKTSLAAFRFIGCSGYARVDMRMDKKGDLYVIEINPNPDISFESGARRQAAAAGMKYTQFIDKIMKLAWEKKKNAHKNKAGIIRGQSGVTEPAKKHARI